MTPHISKELDHSGVMVAPFRVLVHLARCADRNGVATETVAATAATCVLPEVRTRHSLRTLSAGGFIRLNLDGEAAHVTLTEPLIAKDGVVALVVPGWLDDSGVSPAACRLFFHYLQNARDGRVTTYTPNVSNICRMSRRCVRVAEAELVGRGWLRFQGDVRTTDYTERLYSLTLPEDEATGAGAKEGRSSGVMGDSFVHHPSRTG